MNEMQDIKLWVCDFPEDTLVRGHNGILERMPCNIRSDKTKNTRESVDISHIQKFKPNHLSYFTSETFEVKNNHLGQFVQFFH